MSQAIVLSGMGTRRHLETLRRTLTLQRPQVLGVAAAFVSVQGVTELLEIMRDCGQPKCRLIAGIDNAITHPEALYLAQNEGWRVRLGRPQKVRGIFHPKLLVAGRTFSRTGGIKEMSCVYVGSSNLTAGGLERNIECGLVADADGCVDSASAVFAELWHAASAATKRDLRNYAARFAERARRRPVSEITDLGINDSQKIIARVSDLLVEKASPRPAIRADYAVAAWAGLQSFTGEYRFQVEFPRHAGEVISRIIRRYTGADERIEVYCPDDETTRPMQYRFYEDNGMFRLNVPNDVPGVKWARAHRDGLAIVESGPPGGAPLRLRILRPSVETSEIVGRSVALGTWGRTSTRTYGWY